MSSCRNVLWRVALCGLLLRVSSVGAYTVVSFSGAGAPKACAGDNFGDAVSKGGQRPSYYGSNFATGFKCPSKVSSSIDPSNKHAHSQAGYLFVYGGSFHAKVPSSWNPPSYYGEVTFHSCRHCRLGGDAIGWDQWSYSTYECSTNVLPRWAFDSPYVDSVQLDTSGGNVIGGTVNLKAPDGGVSGQTGEWNDYGFNAPPQWVWYPEYDPEGGGGDGVDEAQNMNYWTQSKVGNIVSGVFSIDDRLRQLKDDFLDQLGYSMGSFQAVTDLRDQWNAYRQSTASHRAIVEQFMAAQAQGQNQGFANIVSSVSQYLNPLDDIKTLLAQIRDKPASSLPPLDLDLGNYVPPSSPQFGFEAPSDVSGGSANDIDSMLGTLEAKLNDGEGVFSDCGISVRSALFSLVGEWQGIGRTAPAVSFSFTLPLIGGWNWHFDFTQWHDLIQFFRAICAIMIWLWLCFAVSRLLSDMFNAG